MTKGERIRQKRKELGHTLDYVAKQVGVSRQTMSRYETGVLQNIPSDTIEKIAIALNTTPSYIMGWQADDGGVDIGLVQIDTGMSEKEASEYISRTEKQPLANCKELSDVALAKFPIIGSIAAGYDCCALEEYTGEYAYFPLAELSAPVDEYFVLRVKGNSMYPKLLEDDTVLVRRKQCVESGKIAVVLYNGEEATVKRINYTSGEKWLELAPINPEYQAKRIEGADLEQCRILGEVVKLIRDM